MSIKGMARSQSTAAILAMCLMLALVPLGKSHGDGEKKVCILFFYSPTCKFCHDVDELLRSFESQYTKVEVYRLNILDHENMRLKERLEESLDVPQEKRGIIPAVYVGGQLLLGQDDIIENLASILETLEDSPCQPEILSEDGLQSAIQRIESFTVSAVVGAALIDSLNPCSLSTLMLLMAFLASSRGRRNMLFSGMLFVLGVFAAYTLLGFGFLAVVGVFEWFVEKFRKFIYILISIATFILGSLNLLDYLKMRRGESADSIILKTPRSIRFKIEGVLRVLAENRHIYLLSPAVGFGISFFEFMCTGQVYLPTIVYIASFPQLREKVAAYLLIYNMTYVTPLLIVLAISYLTVSFSYSRMMLGLTSRIHIVKLLTTILLFFLSLSAAILSFVPFRMIFVVAET